MTINWKALTWAALILGVALLVKRHGLSNAAAFGIIAGISAVAIGTLGRRQCKR